MPSFRYLTLLICFLCFVSAAQAKLWDFTAPPFAGAGDGKTDNRAALSTAFSTLQAGDTLYFPPGDYGIVLTEGQLKVPDGVTLLGQGTKSRLLLTSSGPADKYRAFLRLGSQVTLEGLTIERAASFPVVLFPLFGELEDVTFRNCSILGNKTKFPEGYCHSFQVGNGSLTGLTFQRTELRNCSYGLFQANEATGSLRSVLVEDCYFAQNTSSDLEFNSPRGQMEDIRVRRCIFEDNLCKSPSAGFAVGFANVKRGKVEHCLIKNYGSEALHVEDRSEDIQLSHNTIVNSSTLQANGVIMVLSDSKNVEIEDNFIDARAHTNRTHLILVTAGGDRFKNPSQVTVKDNVLLHGEQTRTWYLQPGSTSAQPAGNIVVPYGEAPPASN